MPILIPIISFYKLVNKKIDIHTDRQTERKKERKKERKNNRFYHFINSQINR